MTIPYSPPTNQGLSPLAVLIASSIRDLAAANIVDKLRHRLPFNDSGMVFDDSPILRNGNLLLVRTESDSIYASGLDKIPGVESIIFASRHSSSSNQATLTVHAPGNPLEEAKYGGNPRSLAIADPNRMRTALIALNSGVIRRRLSYRVSFEATHHGPTEMVTPVMFVEIGSGPIQWKDPVPGEVAANAILKAAGDNSSLKAAVGFGGGHYAPKFTDLVLKSNLSIGHIFPKYCIYDLDDSTVSMAFSRTRGLCTLAVIDWKGLRGSDRERLLDLLSKMGIETCKV